MHFVDRGLSRHTVLGCEPPPETLLLRCALRTELSGTSGFLLGSYTGRHHQLGSFLPTIMAPVPKRSSFAGHIAYFC